MRKLSSLLLASALFASVAVPPAFADDGRWRNEGRHDERHDEHAPAVHWRDGDIHRFHEHDYDFWRGGRWYHGFHEGRGGWWWIVGGLWYFYPAPIYPYPDPYTPPMVVAEPVPVAPLGVPPSSVYYCPNPAGYYPYVARCYAAWERVAPVTTAAPPVVQPQVVAPPQPAMQEGQRQIDDRQLNAYAVEFQNVNLNDPRARARLRALEKQVEAFRQALYQRTYNAMDILRDAEGLEKRIAAQRQKLPKAAGALPVAPAAQTPLPPPQ